MIPGPGGPPNPHPLDAAAARQARHRDEQHRTEPIPGAEPMLLYYGKQSASHIGWTWCAECREVIQTNHSHMRLARAQGHAESVRASTAEYNARLAFVAAFKAAKIKELDGVGDVDR